MVGMKDWFSKWTSFSTAAATGPETIMVGDMAPYALAGANHSVYDGDKFPGGFGATKLFDLDYWTLRERSAQLFTENLYARGIIRRLVTNEINTGLSPEAAPYEAVIGVPENSLADWTEVIENRFAIWGKSPRVCDWRQADTFGALQRAARMESLIEGDVLVVMRMSRRTKLPMVQLIGGSQVQTPLGGRVKLRAGHTIQHGVELDRAHRVMAHWVRQNDGGTERIPAFGERSGRRVSWLVYGTDKRYEHVRGQPMLSLILQSLKEIDRYRDSVQRKAVINSVLAMFIKKNSDKSATLPMSGGATKKGVATVTDSDGSTRNLAITKQIPGIVAEELQEGEEPVGFHSQGIDLAFGTFEASIIQAVAWANEIPPEILTLAFSNNYSASQAAINEFKIYINRVWSEWGERFCSPIYTEWLISEALLRNIDAVGFLEAWRDPTKYDVFGAWILADWYGSIKPSTDMLKQTKASAMLVRNGWSTNARESRVLTGTKFSGNVRRLKGENESLVDANASLLEAEAAETPAPAPGAKALSLVPTPGE